MPTPMTTPAPARGAGPGEAGADERALVQRLRAGDRAAFTAVVVQHGGALLRLATALVKDRALAEEVAQDVWLSALEHLDAFEGRASLRTWLFQIVANQARTRLGREGRSVPFSSLGSSANAAGLDVDPDRFDQGGMWKEPPGRWSEENPERLAQGVETRAAIERAIADLPEAQRAVITLRDVEELETEEICALLDITVSNQRVLLHRARARVRQALERYMAGAR